MAIEFLNGIKIPAGEVNLKGLTIERVSGSGATGFDNDALGSYILSPTDGGWGAGERPSGSHNGVGVISFQTHSGNYYTQLALSTNTNDLFIRSANASETFGDYSRLWNDSHFSTTNVTNWNTAYTHSQATHAPTDAEANVQADWTETTTTSDAFILNKPSTFPPSTHNHDGDYIQDGGTTAISDINTIGTESIKHRWNNSTTGRPASPQTNEYGTVTTLTYDSSYATQLAWDIDQGNLYARTLNLTNDSGTWKRFALSTEIPTDHGDHDGLYLPIGGGDLTGDLEIKKTDPKLTFFDNSGANGTPNGEIVFSEANNTENFKLRYNGLNDRFEYWGLISGTSTLVGYWNRSTDTSLHSVGSISTGSDGNSANWKTAYDHSQATHAPTDAEANVQADWTETTDTSDAFILNKPSTFPPSSHNHDGRYLRTHARYSDDLDTIDSSGVYIWDVSEADDEPTGASDGLLTIKYWDSSYWATASFQDFHNRKLYIKSKKNGTWQSDWAQVWTTDQLTTTNKTNYDTAYTHSQATHAPTDAEANVQADWNETTTTSDAFILNKPTIPTDHDGLYLPIGGGSLTGDLLPDADSTYDIGSNSSKWAEGHFDHLYVGETANNPRIDIYTENGTASLADTFEDSTTDKSYIYFKAGTNSNDPGFIMHETSESSSPDERNEGVLHLVPSDDNGYGDYVSIHGTNDADAIKLHTNGRIETAANIQLDFLSGSGSVKISDSLDVTGSITVAGTVDGVDISALPTSFAPTDAEANVQADWNETTTTSDAFILNKPTIPTDYGDHDGLYLPIDGGSLTGALTIAPATGLNAVLNINGDQDSFIEKDTGNHLYIANNANNKDIKFRVKDNSTNVIALTLDGSENGNASFTGQVKAANVFIADDVDVTNGTPATGNARFSGYGLNGNRGAFYITNGGGTVQIGNGATHNANPTATFSSTEITFARNTNIGTKKYFLTVNAPTSLTTTIVNSTINVGFTASTTTNIDYYLIFSSVGGGDYGLISVIPPTDFGATMSVIDNSFDATGTQAYRVYAVKNGVYSTALTGSQAFAVTSAEPTNMSVVNLNKAYYVQWDPPSANARFITAYNVYKHEHATQASLDRDSATLIYSGLNTSYMYQINGSNNVNYHQFWVETTIG